MHQFEAGRFVDRPSGGQYIVGPKRHALVSELAAVCDAALNQAAADASAAHIGFNVEKSELGYRLGFFDQEHRTYDAALDFCDPRPLTFGIEILDKLAAYLRNHGLEGMIPTVLSRIEHGVSVYDPADVAGLQIAEAAVRLCAFVTQQPLGGHQRGAQERALGRLQRLQQLLNFKVRTRVDTLEFSPPFVCQFQDLLAAVHIRGAAPEIAALLQSFEQATEIAGIESKIRRQIGGCQSVSQSDFVDEARFRQVEFAAEQRFLQHADPSRVKAREAANRGNGLIGSTRGDRHVLEAPKAPWSLVRYSCFCQVFCHRAGETIAARGGKRGDAYDYSRMAGARALHRCGTLSGAFPLQRAAPLGQHARLRRCTPRPA